MTDGLSHLYHLGESTFIFGDIGCDFRFLFTVSMNFVQANRLAPDVTPRCLASHLGLFCLPMFHKKDTGLKRVKFRSKSIPFKCMTSEHMLTSPHFA